MTSNTPSLGASHSLIIVISLFVSPFPFLLSLIAFLLLLDFLQIVVQPIEAFVPEAAVWLHPLRNVAQRLPLQLAGSPLGLAAPSDQTRPLQHFEVLGNRGHGHAERL